MCAQTLTALTAPISLYEVFRGFQCVPKPPPPPPPSPLPPSALCVCPNPLHPHRVHRFVHPQSPPLPPLLTAFTPLPLSPPGRPWFGSLPHRPHRPHRFVHPTAAIAHRPHRPPSPCPNPLPAPPPTASIALSALSTPLPPLLTAFTPLPLFPTWPHFAQRLHSSASPHLPALGSGLCPRF